MKSAEGALKYKQMFEGDNTLSSDTHIVLDMHNET